VQFLLFPTVFFYQYQMHYVLNISYLYATPIYFLIQNDSLYIEYYFTHNSLQNVFLIDFKTV